MDLEFTVAYRITEESQIDPSEIPLVLQRLNGNRSREVLPRLVGVVRGFPCTVSGETKEELLDNAKKKIQSLRRVWTSRGSPIGVKVAVQPPASSGQRTLIVIVPESTERIS